MVQVSCCKGRFQWSRWVVVTGDVNSRDGLL